jgi:hypothetical protein
VGFKPTTEVFEQVKTVYALDFAATVTGCAVKVIIKVMK